MGSKAREGKSRLECRRPRPLSRKVSKVPTLSEEGTAVWPCKALLSSISPRLERIFGWQSALSRVGERDDPWPKKTSRDDHRYRSEISWKIVPFGMGIGRRWRPRVSNGTPILDRNVGLRGGGLFSEEYAAKSEPLKSWKPRLTNCRKVAFPNVLLDTIASSMIRVCTFRLTRGTP